MDESNNNIKEPEKRAFLKGAGLSIAALLVGGLSIERYAVPKDRSVPVMDNFPLAILEDPSGHPVTTSEVIEFAGAKTTTTSSPILVFNYPLQDEPTFLIALKGVKITTPKTLPSSGFAPVPSGTNAPMDGIIYDSTTNTSILAVSGICQHLGCVPPFLDYHPGQSVPFESELIGYKLNGTGAKKWPDYGLIYCKCHGSQYNPVWGGRNLYNNGPAASPARHSLPQIMLATDSNGYIYAYGINSSNAVIRTHLNFPGGETYGPGVKSEDLTGGTAIRQSTRSLPASLSLYKNTTLESVGPSSLGTNQSSGAIILYKTTVVSNENKNGLNWKGTF